MNFGYFLRPGVIYEGMLELAQHAEELGLHGATPNDHVLRLVSPTAALRFAKENMTRFMDEVISQL